MERERDREMDREIDREMDGEMLKSDRKSQLRTPNTATLQPVGWLRNSHWCLYI